jgi:cellulose synthase/poly-beta-1,6-N-acetylglucosamine synthase-like glycosyltransferase
MTEFVFWLCAFGVAYAYAGYPLILWLLTRSRTVTAAAQTPRTYPTVTMIVPVHNERAVIDEKLRNTRELQYPSGGLEVLFVSDGSTDGTPDRIAQGLDPRSSLITLSERGGKASALNAGLERARHDIVVFSDASILLAPDAILEIVAPFDDARLGCVSGEDWIPEGGGEGLYGRYELWLRQQESKLHSIVGASGSFYAQRRVLCEPFVPNVAPDFLSVLRTIERGYRAITCPGATGRMAALSDAGQEFHRKVRTILRGLTTLVQHRALLNPFRNPPFAFELISHKLARWLVPFFLIGTFVTSAALSVGSPWYALLFLAQAGFYVLAIAGYTAPGSMGRWLTVKVAVYFSAVNLATLAAWYRFASGARQELWSPSRREAA